MHTEKVFADILNCFDIYRTYIIFHMANLLNNNGMGMIFHAGILLTFLNGQIQNSNINCIEKGYILHTHFSFY